MISEPIDGMSQRISRLEKENKYWRVGVGALLLGCAVLYFSGLTRPAVAVGQQAAPNAAKPSDPAAIYEEIHAKSERAIALINQTIQIGAPVKDAATVVDTWSLRVLWCDMYRIALKSGAPLTADPEVYLSTAKGPPDPDRLKAFREHATRMKTWEVFAINGRPPGVG